MSVKVCVRGSNKGGIYSARLAYIYCHNDNVICWPEPEGRLGSAFGCQTQFLCVRVTTSAANVTMCQCHVFHVRVQVVAFWGVYWLTVVGYGSYGGMFLES